MEIQGTTEQLIQYLDAQNTQISKSYLSKSPGKIESRNSPPLCEKLGYISGALSVGLIITDVDGTIISFNKTIQDLIGITIEEYKNTNVSNLYADPNDRQRLFEILSKSNTVRDFEVRIKRKDGSLRTLLSNVDYIELDDEDVLLTSLYDITQYKQEQESLKESDKNYRTLFSNAPVGITVTDSHGKIIVSNKAIKELLGYSAEDLLSISAEDFYCNRGDRLHLLNLTDSLGNVRDFETVFRHKNGSSISVLINTDKIEFKNQKNMLLTSIRDISSLKRIEDELTKERDFSNAILNITASLILVLDCKGTITRFNRACEQATGYTFDEMKGTYFGDAAFIDPILTKEIVNKLLHGEYPSTYNTTWFSKNGEKHLISWTDTRLINTEGQTEYVIATGIDITKRQQAEEELQKANKELASWVKELQERTEELNQMNEMGEQLQSCQTITEACAISAQYIKRICPASNGALYLINSSKDLAEAVEMWGEPAFTDRIFAPLSCWAMRRGRQHLLNGTHPGLRCQHVTGPQSGQYLCVPLLVNGEAIGILHLNHVPSLDENQQSTFCSSFTDRKNQIITTIAEHIALALSNLRLKDTLRQQSIHDALTGLFNRRYMEETLDRELKRAQRDNKSVGVIMFDIDHFKQFNDLAGHDAGDALLRELGAFLNKTTRGGDIVCRYGGEEFLAVLPGISLENARLQAERLRQGAKELLVYHLGNPLAKCTISLGVAVFPENGLTSEALLKSVDDALYRAKNEGRDRVILA